MTIFVSILKIYKSYNLLFLIYFLLKEVPSDSLALPPVGVHRTVEHDSQVTAVWAWENTVVMFKQPGHLTSKKYDLGDWTKVFNLCFLASEAAVGCNKSWTKTWSKKNETVSKTSANIQNNEQRTTSNEQQTTRPLTNTSQRGAPRPRSSPPVT